MTDVDQQGRRVIKLCQREGITHIALEQFSDRRNTDCGIEDVIGIESYIVDVNTDYQGFEWFCPLDAETVRKKIGDLSLGRYLQKVFEEQFGRNFEKVAVAISLAGKLGELPESALERLRRLIAAVKQRIKSTCGPERESRSVRGTNLMRVNGDETLFSRLHFARIT